jgi:hypothetical protein
MLDEKIITFILVAILASIFIVSIFLLNFWKKKKRKELSNKIPTILRVGHLVNFPPFWYGGNGNSRGDKGIDNDIIEEVVNRINNGWRQPWGNLDLRQRGASQLGRLNIFFFQHLKTCTMDSKMVKLMLQSIIYGQRKEEVNNLISQFRIVTKMVSR